jgi:hypothetical protein
MESTRNEVKQLIEKLSDRYNNLPEGPVHQMDADLLHEMLRQLYEKIEALRSRPAADITVKAEPHQYSPPEIIKSIEPLKLPIDVPPVAPSVIPPVVDPPFQEFRSDVHPVEEPQFEKPVVPEVTNSVKSEFHAGNEFARDPGPVYHKTPAPPVDLFGTPTVADMLKSESPSLNDRITTGKHDLSLADRMHLKPISDIKAAIGINEKFQFINELFEGSADRYNEAINLLNVCSGNSEAIRLFEDLKMRYGWDDQGPVFLRLHEFVERRYISASN